MPIMFKWEDKTLDVDDVPLDVYEEIEKKTGVEWYRLSARPLAYAAGGQMLARRCAEILEVKLPDTISPRMFVELFEVVEEPNRPTEYEDGMPDPKVEGSDQVTT